MPKVEVDLPLNEAMYISELAKERQTTFDLVLREIFSLIWLPTALSNESLLNVQSAAHYFPWMTPEEAKLFHCAPTADCGYVFEIRSYDS